MHRLTLLALMVSLALLSGCHSTVHKNTWFEEDGRIVRKEPPPNSTLPAPRESSFADVRFGVRVSLEADALGDQYLGILATDQPDAVTPEPLDLDATLRIDGESGAWIKPLLIRTYKALNVPKGTGTTIRLHELDWTHRDLKATRRTQHTGDPSQPHVEANLYLEYWFVGREYIEGEDWYYIVQFRSRFESDHPDWEVFESAIEFEAPGDMKISLPLFPREE